jgi:hypothetical protein
MKITDKALFVAYTSALNRLHKWRKIFVSWQLGTRTDTDGEALAVADHRSLSLLMRAELNAFTAILVKKGVFTEEEFTTQIIEEAKLVDKELEARFPGVRAVGDGLVIDVEKFKETVKKLHFPP